MDLTKIPGLGKLSIQNILSGVGLDMNKWPTEKHFSSWLGLSPSNKITEEKVFSTKTRKVVNRAATAFRLAAYSVGKSQTSLGAFYRRQKSRLGAPKAITATARKIACLFYIAMKFDITYVEQGVNYYEQNYQKQIIKNLMQRASKMGFTLVKTEDCTAVS